MAKSSLKVVKTAKFSVLGLPSETDVEISAEKKAKKAGKCTGHHVIVLCLRSWPFSFSVGNVLGCT
jgi:hypothetical protein